MRDNRNFGMLHTEAKVKKFEKPYTDDAAFEAMVNERFESICDKVRSTHDRVGHHPAALVAIGRESICQLLLESFSGLPDPTKLTYALMQNMRHHDAVKPEAFVFIVTSEKYEDPEFTKSLGPVLSITLTTGYGDHRICMMDVNNITEKTGKPETNHIYEVDGPTTDIWKVWNDDEQFGPQVIMSKDIPLGIRINKLPGDIGLKDIISGLNNPDYMELPDGMTLDDLLNSVGSIERDNNGKDKED